MNASGGREGVWVMVMMETGRDDGDDGGGENYRVGLIMTMVETGAALVR